MPDGHQSSLIQVTKFGERPCIVPHKILFSGLNVGVRALSLKLITQAVTLILFSLLKYFGFLICPTIYSLNPGIYLVLGREKNLSIDQIDSLTVCSLLNIFLDNQD